MRGFWNRGATAEIAESPDLGEQLRQYRDSYSLLQERIAELEFAAEDEGWSRITAESGLEFSRGGLGRFVSLARIFYLKNPIINRAVEVQKLYVFGQGVSIRSKEPALNDSIQAFMDDRGNKRELTSHAALGMKEIELATTGNVFLALFTDPVERTVRVRSFPFEECTEIWTNPDDAKEPWFYRREYTVRELSTGKEERRTVLYPDLYFRPEQRPEIFAGHRVAWDSPVYHVKAGGFSHMRFGVPEVLPSLDWAKAYREFLEDWATLVRSLSRFAWKMTVKGGATKVASAKTVLGTTMNTGGGGGRETNPSPVAGSTFIKSDRNVEMDPIPKTGATTSADDGRRLLLMAAAGVGLPETFFGDVDAGTLATAKSLDRPTELKFRDRQTLWADVFSDVLQHVFDVTNGENTTGQDRPVDVEFPPILEHDIQQSVTAITQAVTLGGKAAKLPLRTNDVLRMVLRALGEDNIDEIIDSLGIDEEELLTDRIVEPDPAEPGMADQIDPEEEEAAMQEAVRLLVAASRS